MSSTLFDAENELAASQEFTGSTTVSENSYEKATAAQDLSLGRRMAVAVYFEAAGSGTTHTLQAIQADNTALTTNKEVLSEVTVDTADLTLGYPVEIPFPLGSMTRKHIGFQHAASGGSTTATISAYLVPQDEIVEKHKAFPKVVDAEV